MINPNFRDTEYTLDELIKLVRESQEGHILPGRKPAGLDIFLHRKDPKKPKWDVVHYWKELYIRCVDEYEFALKAVGDWDLYNKLKRNSWILRKTYIPKWEEEKQMRLRSEAMKEVVKDMRKGDVSSAKWLEKHLASLQPSRTKYEKKQRAEKVDEIMSGVMNTWDSLQDEEYKNLN